MEDLLFKDWIENFCQNAVIIQDTADFKIYCKKETSLNISWLSHEDRQLVVLSESLFDKFKESYVKECSVIEFQSFVTDIDFKWNPVDLIYHLSDLNFNSIATQNDHFQTRLLTVKDSNAFNKMIQNCSEEERDAAYVDLHHSLVAGVFFDSERISCASAYPFFNSDLIYDIGYLTVPQFRGQGIATVCTSYLIEHVLKVQKVPQIRVQENLIQSIQVAKRLGFSVVGQWIYDLQD